MDIVVPNDQNLCFFFLLYDQLQLLIEKQHTTYHLAIPHAVRVACTLLKLAQGASMRLCSKLCAIDTSTIFNVVHDTCRAVNIALHHEFTWPTSTHRGQVQNDFKLLCGLPAVVQLMVCVFLFPNLG